MSELASSLLKHLPYRCSYAETFSRLQHNVSFLITFIFPLIHNCWHFSFYIFSLKVLRSHFGDLSLLSAKIYHISHMNVTWGPISSLHSFYNINSRILAPFFTALPLLTYGVFLRSFPASDFVLKQLSEKLLKRSENIWMCWLFHMNYFSLKWFFIQGDSNICVHFNDYISTNSRTVL